MSASGVNVVINMGTDSDKNVVREHLESKYGKVEVIDLTVKDGKLVDKEGDEHARSILSRVDSHSKITISGQHSNLLGETFQMESAGREGVSITERTRHFSDIVQFLGERLEPGQFHSPSEQLSISVLSCFAGEGEDNSLAAKMQRMFVVAYNVYTAITARRFLVYIDKPSYTVTRNEYGEIRCGRKTKEDYKLTNHQKTGSKMKYYWNESGEQKMCDAYPLRKKMKDKIISFCNSIESINPNVIRILDQLRVSFDSLDSMGHIYDLLVELREVLPPKKREAMEGILKYAEKHFDLIPTDKVIGSSVSQKERESFKFFEQIVDEKLKGLSDQIDPGLKKLIRDHYVYNHKKQLKTEYLDKILEELKAVPLGPEAFERIQRHLDEFIASTPEEPQIRNLYNEDSSVRGNVEREATHKKRKEFSERFMQELRGCKAVLQPQSVSRSV